MMEINNKLDTLCIFRELLSDSVISKLSTFLRTATSSAYAEFVAALYTANGGDLGLYLKALCENSENIYVRRIGLGEAIPAYMDETLREELKILQELADLTSTDLKAQVDYQGFLPDYANTPISLLQDYLHRAENISRFGYGIYANNPMFYVDDSNSIVPVAHPETIELSELVDYERERKIISDNTSALIAGKPAANILLTGDAGTGKSSTVKAIGNAFFKDGLRIIEVRKDQLRAIPDLLNELGGNPLKFILFIDDLSFGKDDDNFNALKAVLEGSVSAKPSNVVIYATSNRRHVVKESFSDREGDDIHRNDTMQELISLSERFGIHISFFKPNKETFLHIVRHLAEAASIDMAAEELEKGAERLALERGGRSARLARQYVDSLIRERI